MRRGGGRRATTFVLAGLAVTLVLAGFVSHYAGSAPDGLTKVADQTGIAAEEREHARSGAVFADYSTENVGNTRLAGGLAGVVGVLVTFLAGAVLSVTLRRRRGPGQQTRQQDTS